MVHSPASAPPRNGDRLAYGTCSLCEAGCGLEVSLRGRDVVSVRGDREHVTSRGYLCPKGASIGELHADPDRLRRPLIRRGDRWAEVSWDEAFAEAHRLLQRVVDVHGRGATGIYLGNPNIHSLDGQIYVRPLVKALGTRNVFTASTVDQRPKEVAAGLMFGTALSVPVPDLDRTHYLMVIGANPLESNGSLATAPDWRGRLRRLRERGGRLVVVDPRRTRTAAVADVHVRIRPGTDAYLLLGIVHVLVAESLVDLGPAGEWVAGVEAVEQAVRPFAPTVVADVTGVDAAQIVELARELAGATSAAVYGRMGTTTTSFGTLTSWLVDVCNTLTGNLDRPGGAMFARAAVGAANTRGRPRFGPGVQFGRWHTRVRGLPETYGELPAVCLAEEIQTPGPGQIRALITVAGNPVLSVPGGDRLDAALGGLDAMISVDCYLNETTRRAHVILPVPSPLQRDHYDIFLAQLAVRNAACYSPPVLPLDDGQLREWEVLCRLTATVQAVGADAATATDAATVDDALVSGLLRSAVADPESAVAGREVAELVAALGTRRGPERVLDLMVRVGPYGDGFGARPDGLTLDLLRAHPHGVDLGPLQPRLPEVLRTPSGMVDLAPPTVLADLDRLQADLRRRDGAQLMLVGRRHLRSNNSWMHNDSTLMRDKPRCTLQIHPTDAAALGLVEGAAARVSTAHGSVVLPVEVTEDISCGVVSIPIGWGHDLPGIQLRVAAGAPGVNYNLLVDRDRIDPLSGTAALNAVPVEVSAIAQDLEAAGPVERAALV